MCGADQRFVLGAAILVAIFVGCEPATEPEESAGVEAPPPVQQRRPSKPPAPLVPPVVEVDITDPQVALEQLRGALGVPAAVGQADWSAYAQIAEAVLPNVEPDGQKLESPVQRDPLAALRTLLVPPPDDVHLASGQQEALLAVHNILLSQLLAQRAANPAATSSTRGTSRPRPVNRMALRTLKNMLDAQAKEQDWELADHERSAIADWLAAQVLADQLQPGAPADGTAVVTLSPGDYSPPALRASSNRHRRLAWEHLRTGLNELIPLSENPATSLRFRLHGQTAKGEPEFSLQVVNRSEGPRAPCIVESRFASDEPNVAANQAAGTFGQAEAAPARAPGQVDAVAHRAESAPVPAVTIVPAHRAESASSPAASTIPAHHAESAPVPAATIAPAPSGLVPAYFVRQLDAGSAQPLEVGTVAKFSLNPQIDMAFWDAESREAHAQGYTLGRFVALPRRRLNQQRELLATLLVPDDQPYRLALRSSNPDKEADVAFAVREAPNRENGWYVLMAERDGPGPQTIALLEIDNDALYFTWNTKASSQAALLGSQVLELSSGNLTRKIFLWQPETARALHIDMTKDEMTVDVPLKDVPDKSALRLHVTRLQGAPLDVASVGDFGRWIDIEFPNLKNALLRVRLADPRNEPTRVELRPVVSYRGEEGDFTARAMLTMQQRNAELVRTLPRKIQAVENDMYKMNRQFNFYKGNRANIAKIQQMEAVMRDTRKKYEGLVNALVKAKERLAWSLRAGEVVKALHGTQLHFIVATAGENRQILVATERSSLDEGPLLVQHAGQ